MKWSFASVGLIILGLTGVAIIMLFQQITTNNENDYYLLKEVTEAAMIDAIDLPYYRETGDLKIIKEKFVENFTRRFAESTIFVSSDYTINFYDIMEVPPKVSIIIDTGLGQYTIHGDSSEYNIANKLDAILEYTGKYTDVSINNSYYGNPYVSKTLDSVYYAIISKSLVSNNFSEDLSLNVPGELVGPHISDVKINNVSYKGIVTTQRELNEVLVKYNLFYVENKIDNYMQFINDFSNIASNVDIDYYNCGVNRYNYTCNDENNYWITISGKTSDDIVVKYEVTWSYKEYELD